MVDDKFVLVVTEKFKKGTDVRVIARGTQQEVSQRRSEIKFAGRRGQPSIIPEAEVESFRQERLTGIFKPGFEAPTPEEIKVKTEREKAQSKFERLRETAKQTTEEGEVARAILKSEFGIEAKPPKEEIVTPTRLEEIKAQESLRRQRAVTAKQKVTEAKKRADVLVSRLKFRTPEEAVAAGFEVAKRPPPKEVPARVEGVEDKERITPSGLISPAPAGLRFGTFLSPEQQKQFEKEGAVGKVKSFVSGGVGILKSGVEFFRPKVPKTREQLQLGVARAKAIKLEDIAPDPILFGQALQQTVKERPFALAGQIAAVELTFRGLGKARKVAVSRQPTEVKLATKGELITTTSPTGEKLTKIKPVKFAAETGGDRIAGIGAGRAVTTPTGKIAGAFEFQIGKAKRQLGTTITAVKGKFVQPTPTITRGATISETITTRGFKVTKEKGISTLAAKQVKGGEFPVIVTSAVDIGKGKLKIVERAKEIATGRVAEPKFVRAGVVRKEAEVLKPVAVKQGEITAETKPLVTEQFAFLEKGVSAKVVAKEVKARDILKTQKVRVTGVTDIGGLVPPVQIAIPKPKIKGIRPEGIVVQDFLKGIRTAVKTERIASVATIRGAGVVGTSRVGVSSAIKPISAAKPIQRQIPRIEAGVVGALKPITETMPRIQQDVGIVSQLKPATAVSQVTGQRVVAKPLLRLTTAAGFVPTPTPLIPVTTGGGFIFPLPSGLKPIKEKEKKRRLPFGRNFFGTPSLSVVLGAKGKLLTPGQIAGVKPISPFQQRALPKRRKKKKR